MVPERKIIIVDGSNYTGKSTALERVKRLVPGSTIIEHHGYYRLHFSRELGEKIPITSSHQIKYGQIVKENSETVEAIKKYNLERLLRSVELAEHDIYDDFIFDRLHASDYVYWKLINSKVDFGDYEQIEERLNHMKACMFILTVNDKDLEQRMENTEKSERKTGKTSALVSPFFLSPEGNKKRIVLYNEFYEKSSIKRKMLINTSYYNPEHVIEKIKEMVSV